MRQQLWLASLLAWLTACAAPSLPAPTPTHEVIGEVVVFAASSLTDAFRDVAAGFEHAHPGVRVTLNFGASTQLRTQLEQGARAEVFASADQTQMDAARRAGVLDGEDRIFARNRLTIITPKD